MATQPARQPWTLALRGLLVVLLGVLPFVVPGVTPAALLGLVGAYGFLDGMLALATAAPGQAGRGVWWGLLLAGGAGALLGGLTFTRPAVTALGLLDLLACAAILSGVLAVTTAFRLRREFEGEPALAVAGLLSLASGLLLLVGPEAVLRVLRWLTAGYTVGFGVALVALALRLRNWAHPAAAFGGGDR